jgi:hypothetical protein
MPLTQLLEKIYNTTTNRIYDRRTFIGFPLGQQGSSCISVSDDVSFYDKFASDLVYDGKLFSDAQPLCPVHIPKLNTDKVLEQTGGATMTRHLLDEGTRVISDSQIKITNETFTQENA